MGMRSLRKAISFILSFVMVVGICFTALPQKVEAAGDNLLFSVTADKEEVQRGDEIKVTVGMSGNTTDAYTLQYRLNYDNTRLEFVNAELGEVANGAFASSVNGTNERVNVVIMRSDAPLSNGVIVTATFKVKEDAPTGTSQFVSEPLASDEMGENAVPHSVEDNTNMSVVIPATGISLNKESTTIAKGGTEQLEAQLTPEGSNSAITWSSENEEVATVSEDGTVTGVEVGTTTITATANGHSDSCEVTVNVPLEGIEITGTASTIKAGTTTQLSIRYIPEEATGTGTVEWSSEHEDIATVDQNGLVTAIKDGTTTITAKIGEISDTYEIRVQEVKMTGISIKGSTMIHRGESETLEVTYEPADTTDDRTVNWSTSDPRIATVDGSGKVEAVGIGSAVITARVGSFEDTCTVEVDAPLERIIPSVERLEMIKNQTADIDYTLDPSDTTSDQTVTFSSSEPSVAEVDASTGLVTAKKAGDTVITLAGADNITATVPVTVTEIPINAVVLDKQSAIVEKGETTELTATVSPDNNTDDDKTITWTSSDETIATVSAGTTDSGEAVTITATDKGGTVTITAEAWNGTKAECTVKVPIHIDSISLPQDVTINRKDTRVLDITYDPEIHDDRVDVTWSSDNEAVATVDANSGMITGIKEGTANITATVTATTLTEETKVFSDVTQVTIQENHLEEALGNTIAFEDLPEALLKNQSINMYDQLNLARILEENEITDDILIQWTSSEEEVASIDQTGRLSGLKEGTTTVTAVITAVDGEGQEVGKYTVETEVEIREIPLESIAFDRIIREMQVGAVETLHIIYNPTDTTDDRNVTWLSSDASILSVENGRLTALKPGTAVITARVGDKEVSCEITVKAVDTGTQGQGSGDGTGTTMGDKSGVSTGDPAYIILYAALFVGAMAAIVIIRRRNRRAR